MRLSLRLYALALLLLLLSDEVRRLSDAADGGKDDKRRERCGTSEEEPADANDSRADGGGGANVFSMFIAHSSFIASTSTSDARNWIARTAVDISLVLSEGIAGAESDDDGECAVSGAVDGAESSEVKENCPKLFVLEEIPCVCEVLACVEEGM